MKRLPLLFAILSVVTAVPAQSASATGEWLVADKSARISVHACGRRLRGTIAWERVHGLDDQNPDPTKRRRPTLGLPILIGMQSTGPDSWAGRIYNADNGKTYGAKVKLLSSTSLHVEGCVMGIPVWGRDLDQGQGARRRLSRNPVRIARTGPAEFDLGHSRVDR